MRKKGQLPHFFSFSLSWWKIFLSLPKSDALFLRVELNLEDEGVLSSDTGCEVEADGNFSAWVTASRVDAVAAGRAPWLSPGSVVVLPLACPWSFVSVASSTAEDGLGATGSLTSGGACASTAVTTVVGIGSTTSFTLSSEADGLPTSHVTSGGGTGFILSTATASAPSVITGVGSTEGSETSSCDTGAGSRRDC